MLTMSIILPGAFLVAILGLLWKPWLGFRDLASRYGDVVYLEVLGRPILVLSDPCTISDFLDKRSANSSDRAASPLLPLAGQAYNFAFMGYGQSWRRHRRAFWQHFHPGVVQDYWPVQRAVTHNFLGKLLDRPHEFKDLIRYTFSASVLKATYGVDIQSEKDELIEIVDNGFAGVREVTVTVQFLLEFLPFLKDLPAFFPGAGFLKTLTKSQAPSEYLVHVPFDAVKAQVEAGEESSCIAAKLITRMKHVNGKGHEEELIAKNVAAVAVEGGADTTFSTMEGVLLALSLHPEVQEKARAELDAVVGPHRLPDFDDKDKLVYINAVVREALRWHNVLPLGVGHKVLEDDELNGYFIPAGTTIIANVWACLHNPKIYHNPDRFYPERFIRDGKLDNNVLDPSSLVFGFGRRVCPGRHFADSALFITIASVLHVFSINPPLSEKEHERPSKLEASHGLLSYPVNCRCSIKPRSEEAAALIRGYLKESSNYARE
ncbi:cytochrome P450 [Trametes maxima]|nr:cytochrome P450 [Trametes maxima]